VSESAINIPLMIMLIGGLVVLTMLIKSWTQPIGVPALVGFLLLGFGLRLGQNRWGGLCQGAEEILRVWSVLQPFCQIFRKTDRGLF
jgi:hypothetical protein